MLPHAAAQAPGGFHQECIAVVVAQGVVHLFEVVQVHEQHRELFAVAPVALDFLFDAVAQHAPVGQAGERVKVGVLADLRLGLLAGGDVGVGAQHAQGFAVGVPADHHAPGHDPFPAAVFAAHPVLVVVSGREAVKVRLPVVEHLRHVFRVGAAVQRVRVLLQLFLGVAIHLYQALGQEFPLVLDVPVPHPIAGALQGQLPALFAGVEQCFGLLALVDIDMGANHAHRAAVRFAPHHHAAGEYPFPAAVFAAQAQFGGVGGGAAFQISAVGVFHTLQIVRVHALYKTQVARGQFVIAIAQHLQPAAGVHLHAGFDIPVPGARAGPLQRQLPEAGVVVVKARFIPTRCRGGVRGGWGFWRCHKRAKSASFTVPEGQYFWESSFLN